MSDTRDVEPFVRYITDVVSAGDTRLANWMMSWLADVIQNPRNTSAACVLLCGPQMSGKSFLQHIMKGVIESKMVTRVELGYHSLDLARILMDALFVECVVDMANKAKMGEELASFVKSADRVVRLSNSSTIVMPNYTRLLLTTTNPRTPKNMFVRTKNDFCTVSHVRPPETVEYFQQLHTWLHVEGGFSKVYSYLRGYIYDKNRINTPYA